MVRQLTADGWECHVAVPGPARLADEYAAAGATLHVVPMARLTTSGSQLRWILFLLGWPVAVARLCLLGRRVGAGVVHSNSLHTWYGWAAAGVLRRPHVWHAREIVVQSPAALRVERFLTKHFAVQVIAMSAAIAAQLDPANVVIVIDDADASRFNPERAGQFRARVGVGDTVPLVGSAARLDTWKGFDTLLAAFPLISAARPDAALVVAGGTVVGKEDYAASLAAQASDLGVRWLGHRSDVEEMMADLDVFVQVSTVPEPFGLVVVEALASGVPVVAGADGGPLEILGSAAVSAPTRQGRLVPPGDAGALAQAVLDLLPPVSSPSSSASRRARPALRTPTAGDFSALFDSLLGSP
jgi:glycosyltransferase involved in cell wall biosynthesis